MTVNNTDAQQSSQPAAAGKPRKSFNPRLGWLLFLIVAPVILGFFAWYYLINTYQLWNVVSATTWLIFIASITGLSFLSSLVLLGITLWYRHMFSSVRRKQPAPGKREIILRLGLGGLVIPLLLALAVATVPTLNNETLLGMTIRTMRARSAYLFLPDIVETVTSARQVETRIAGIQTLGELGSLNELLAIVEQEPQLLEDWLYYNEMVDALARFGPEAREPLLALFRKYEAQAKAAPAGPQPDLHARFFAQTFQSLQQQLQAETLEPAQRTRLRQRLAEIERTLEQELAGLEAEETLAGRPAESLVPNLALDAFIQMETLRQDSEIYTLARSVAADPAYAPGIRASAILLTAKLGAQADFALLLPFLEDDNELLKQAALRAVAILHHKVESAGDAEARR